MKCILSCLDRQKYICIHSPAASLSALAQNASRLLASLRARRTSRLVGFGRCHGGGGSCGGGENHLGILRSEINFSSFEGSQLNNFAGGGNRHGAGGSKLLKLAFALWKIMMYVWKRWKKRNEMSDHVRRTSAIRRAWTAEMEAQKAANLTSAESFMVAIGLVETEPKVLWELSLKLSVLNAQQTAASVQ